MRPLSALLSLFVLSVPGHVTAQELPALGGDSTKVSVSGLSSGGFMAVQYSVAWSSEVMGVGVVAGGLYNCGFVFSADPIGQCMQKPWSATSSWSAVRDFAKAGTIDAATNIARQRVYLFTGQNDTVVAPAMMRSVFNFYVTAGVAGPALRFVDTLPASHAFVSATVGGKCSATDKAYVVKCKVGSTFYDQPHEVLDHIYGLKAPAATTLSAKPIAFDQRLYGGDAGQMADKGYAYVPARCRRAGAGCAVHVVFHGCLQSADSLGSDEIYAKLGYNRWADKNGIIMLYPQVDKNPLAMNPYGCWDWWGYTGLGFQLRHGGQIGAVHQMVARLLTAG
ncbi:extracellular catalytic domain type 2 short-chain-length polyhydroxyalkanoate depolymerase [Sphingomonas azotifigens]|uniref:extracellular catalytic domain type 2 short-chain-length polyhydroxyalkanoate depolymerase n=1 Tax=Sphingomonas azotifigens TaxID=330920 RepID=UPI001C3F524E|nr:hypothetical protein [Sphingomonas azotifigens]